MQNAIRAAFRTIVAAGLALALLFPFLAPQGAAAQDQPPAPTATDITGWEIGSPYNAHYDTASSDKLKGYLQAMETRAPLPDMAPGLILTLRLSEGGEGRVELGQDVTVHLGPAGHVRFLPYMAVPGDKLTLRGSWAEIAGERVFMASKLKVNELLEFKVRRTEDGTPYWGLSRAELLQEKLDQ